MLDDEQIDLDSITYQEFISKGYFFKNIHIKVLNINKVLY